MIGPADIAATIRATWPPASTRRIGPFDVNDGAGAGNRVSAARLSDPLSDGGAVSPGEVSDVATAQAARGTEALFMVFGWQDPLDRLLAAEGYATRDETLILAAPAADIAEAPPPVSCFEIWPPLAVQEEIWDAGGIGPARRAVMRRAEGPKTALFGRINDRPAAAAFIAVHGKVAMLHALEVASRARRNGLARVMMRAGADWAVAQGAETLAVLVTRANTAAQGLYASLGLKPVENYHYRVK
jgi:GNAT superfamily N-acetyltransferase